MELEQTVGAGTSQSTLQHPNNRNFPPPAPTRSGSMETQHPYSLLWHKNISFKSSFLLWRALRGKLPTNDKITNFGVEPSTCVCCFDRSGMDSIEHIFSTGKFAAAVWSSFAATAGMLSDCSSLQALIQQWWAVRPRNAAHKTLLQATPIFICWNLWKNRCAAKYGGKTANISKVKYAIYKDNYKMLTNAFPQVKWPAKWAELIHMSERCVHDIKVNMVTWTRPKDQWIKVNTDGSAINNPGKMGVGGILRDKSDRLVMALTTPLGEGTNNKAELEAVILGLTWALELGYKNIILELVSQLVVHWILKEAAPQWSIITQLGRLQNLISQTQNFKCLHVFREANWVADALSKHSHKTTTPQVYFNIQQMPKEARSYNHLHLLQMPSVRRKKTKRIKEPP
nr:uncharacterized protein LOC104644285 [Solanum lycopersicum]